MTENQEKTNTAVMVEAITALPDEMSDKEILSTLLTICTTYGVSPEKVAMMAAAMIQIVITGDYGEQLERALAEEEGEEEDEG